MNFHLNIAFLVRKNFAKLKREKRFKPSFLVQCAEGRTTTFSGFLRIQLLFRDSETTPKKLRRIPVRYFLCLNLQSKFPCMNLRRKRFPKSTRFSIRKLSGKSKSSGKLSEKLQRDCPVERRGSFFSPLQKSAMQDRDKKENGIGVQRGVGAYLGGWDWRGGLTDGRTPLAG
ncbi:hypothetical protein CDAR_424121 [Caerostris darwini]|uniref:Uncharacterized protein n=1 Tax=Caerostris darwini TaxID=1538125 RepID=A0AAV4T0G4_9ARAC|nr:hypothetical protein CDAR_424121 [Caerostris darwini]